MRSSAIIAVVLTAVASNVGLSVAAHAHATLVSSEPADGAVVAAAPSRFTLTFNEPVAPMVLRLAAPDGKTSTLRAATEREATVAISLPSGLGQGTHVLSWRVVSLDSHPVGGTVVFSIGAPSAKVELIPQKIDQFVAAALWAFKIVFYAGLFIGIGGSLFIVWFCPNTAAGRNTATLALISGLIATPALVGLQGLDALELSLWDLGREMAWRTGLETSFGATAVAAAFALFAGFFALEAREKKAARSLSLLGVVIGGLALALSGHASSAEPQWLTRPAVFLHAVSLMFWTGALVPLRAVMQRGQEFQMILARFSKTICWAIAALILSGTILAVVQVTEPNALLTTSYGALLFTKLALVAILFALATWNRLHLTPATMGKAKAPRRMLARSIAVEIGIVIAIFGLVAGWRFTPPPRALAASSNKPAFIHLHTAKAMAEVTITPGRRGIVSATISIMTGDFGTLDAKEVRLTLENKAAGIEGISRQTEKGADGNWHILRVPLMAAGQWEVQVDILITDFEKVTLADQINIRSHE